MSPLPRLLEELKRRRVYRAAAVYLVAGWAAVQIVATVQPFLSLPPVFVTVVIVLVGAGFPVALGLAWAFDVGPGGITRTPAASGAADAARPSARRAPRWLAPALLLALIAGTLALTTLRGRRSSAGVRAPEPAEGAAADLASIAVLPFHNLSEEKSAAYFSDGITDEILTNLARLSGVKVISHTSVMQYRDTRKPLQQIGRELGVATILEGSVQQVAGRVRVEAQLIDARTDRHLWAERYDRELKDVFAVESDVAEKIAQALRARLTPQERTRLAARPTESVDAHRFYLQAHALWYRETEADLRRAAELFQKAIDLDPGFAHAYSGLAEVHADLGRYGDQVAHIARAKVLARRAVALDSTLGEPHDALGYVAVLEFDLDTAERELRRAVALNPGFAVAHYDLGTVLLYRGRYPEALGERRIAAELDPLMPWAVLGPAEVLLEAGQYDQALAVTRQVAATLPDHFRTHRQLAAIYRRQGRLELAAAETRRAIQLAPGESAPDVAVLGLTQLAMGDRAAAERAYAQLAAGGSRPRVARAALAAQLGRKEEAFALLEQAYGEHAEALLTVGTDPDFAVLHGDSRFQALLRRVGAR